MKILQSFTGIGALLLLATLILHTKDMDEAPKTDLESILAKIERIKTASYVSKIAGHPPGDSAFSQTRYSHYKEYVNPRDTFVGTSFVRLQYSDHTKMEYCYDGNMRARVHWDEKTMEIDSFQNNRLTFRPIRAPFFTRVKCLITYVLTTEDPVRISTSEGKDHVRYTFIIPDTLVEIIGNRMVYPPALHGTYEGEISRYDLWIDKSTDLPCRVKRTMPHDVSLEECLDAKLNEDGLADFVASDYFPDFPLRKKGKPFSNAEALIGKPAPGWMLSDAQNQTFKLRDIKSKVLMLQFTSVSCGPCKLSISFLKELASEYHHEQFDFVAIESFNRNGNVLQRYQDRNEFDYSFLMSTPEVTNNYQVKAVPVFFILDEQRIIRKVIVGYSKGNTDEVIRDTIAELLD